MFDFVSKGYFEKKIIKSYDEIENIWKNTIKLIKFKKKKKIFEIFSHYSIQI